MKELIELFSMFFRIGGFTFGGGYAMLPMIQQEIVIKKQWATEEEVLDYFAIGQMTPGIIAVNTATFVGFKRRGIVGAIVATLGMIAPSLIIITIIAAIFDQVINNVMVQHALSGIRIVVVAFIAQGIYKMGKPSIKGKLTACLFVMAAILLLINVSPIYVIISGALIGLFAKHNERGAK
ncbi:chromate transporter [Candidatus Epulonipiscium fishelsonii]|uniref:Chromate transporter n=1 Tax=Candidatus Epulonipiscium fishelsonii TaxID=77094 RepID=A0ACC8XBZ1_9FIRM|nr:chromate transporter [Epulopiscium sp. SCG-B05WGA-EpuloA1]ONI40079.1 chromate transporter [Epulopiscium sp. SCG-B11WGA-EpuloA1]